MTTLVLCHRLYWHLKWLIAGWVSGDIKLSSWLHWHTDANYAWKGFFLVRTKALSWCFWDLSSHESAFRKHSVDGRPNQRGRVFKFSQLKVSVCYKQSASWTVEQHLKPTPTRLSDVGISGTLSSGFYYFSKPTMWWARPLLVTAGHFTVYEWMQHSECLPGDCLKICTIIFIFKQLSRLVPRRDGWLSVTVQSSYKHFCRLTFCCCLFSKCIHFSCPHWNIQLMFSDWSTLYCAL